MARDQNSDERLSKQQVLDLLSRKLLQTSGDSDLARFGAILFARVANEDLASYEIDELVEFVKHVFANLKIRPAKQPVVNIYNPDFDDKTGSASNDITIIDIVNDNMPFLVDSIMGELQYFGATIKLVAHPIVGVERDKDGNLIGYYDTSNNGEMVQESIISIHIERYQAAVVRNRLFKLIEGLLKDIRSAVNDWAVMRQRLSATIGEYHKNPPPLLVEEVTEAIQFLEWLEDNNFTFLGIREYKLLEDKDGQPKLRQIKGYGILRDPKIKVLRRNKQMVTITPEVLEFLRQPVPLIITKSDVRSRIHRHTYMDYVGIKLFDKAGNLYGELRVIGLFTATAYTKSVRSIPYLRRKIGLVMADARVGASSHSAKALSNILEEYPRDELFQIPVETLTDFANEIMLLEERPRVRALIRRDKFDRFVSALIYIPRDRYNTKARIQIGNYLMDVFDGHISAVNPSYPEGHHARVHYIIGRHHGKIPNVTQGQIEEVIGAIVRTWNDELRVALSSIYPGEKSHELYESNLTTFSNSYQDAFSAHQAVKDLEFIGQLNEDKTLAIDWCASDDLKQRDKIEFKLFHLADPIPLSDRIPLIENMGFRAINERSYRLHPQNLKKTVWLHDIVLERADGRALDLSDHYDLLHGCYMALWQGRVESDRFNSLVILARLNWREVALLRAIGRYFLQTNINYSQWYICQALTKNPDIAKLLVELFNVKFNLDNERRKGEKTVINDIYQALGNVSSLDEDIIIRRYVNFIEALLRTNFFQLDSDNHPAYAISFKYIPDSLDGLPEPKPLREMFVYSPRVEGVHLRFGMIARGGIRWSDRLQDYRTEILGLAKAQQVKNSVIVPLGAKGGFVVKNPPATGKREDLLAEGVACYKIFISNLLAITDNIGQKGTIPPENTIRLDRDDPYLVVAADKGTATFSDIANSISLDKKFWLGDAFASGGSDGYDHKKIGITARGAWESVKRHFRERNINIQSEPFMVIGIGDMSGDVFGNGMLLSKAIKLIAAFDHRDIFIDPEPDLTSSFEERQRIFRLARSSWQDYNSNLISQGGGIYSRNLKSIELSDQACKALAITTKKLTPNALISHILKAPADLLWFGGIGTYIRASDESDADVGDKANDKVRISANQLRARVIGEGANLGVTQKARIEFNSLGGRCNTDAIDNSAGVNMSDIEVNIKIAFDHIIQTGNLQLDERNKQLVAMTDEVSQLCLRNNYLQSLALSLALKRKERDFDYWCQLMKSLDKRKLLDRRVEFLPSNTGLQNRLVTKKYLRRAELCILLAYAKNTLYSDLLETTIIDSSHFEKELRRYFPKSLIEKYSAFVQKHRLRREIIATVLANAMINRGGPAYVSRLTALSGTDLSTITAGYIITRDIFDLTDYHQRIDALDNKVSGDTQLELYDLAHDFLIDRTAWFIANVNLKGKISEIVKRFKDNYREFMSELNGVLPVTMTEYYQAYQKRVMADKVPKDVAELATNLPLATFVCDITLVSEIVKSPLVQCAQVYFEAMERLGIRQLKNLGGQVATADYYDKLAISRAQSAIDESLRAITIEVAQKFGKLNPKQAVESWISERQTSVDRTMNAINEIVANVHLSVSGLSVAAGLLSELGKSHDR